MREKNPSKNCDSAGQTNTKVLCARLEAPVEILKAMCGERTQRLDVKQHWQDVCWRQLVGTA